MGLADLTSADAVREACAEFDQLGRRAFLQKYHFGRSRRYYLRVGERLYDSKPIVGAAHGFEHPEFGPLPWKEFSGGEDTVKAKLESLGFEVVTRGEAPLRESLDHAMSLIRARPPGEWSS